MTLCPGGPAGSVPRTPHPQSQPRGSWRPGFLAKITLTSRDTQLSVSPGRPPVPFSGVYDFPGASQPGDARG